MTLSEKQRAELLLDIRTEAKALADTAFLTKDEAVQELFDTFNYDPAELTTILNEEWSEKIARETTWADKTDVDRLFEAFATLEKQSVIALHNPHQSPDGAHEAINVEAYRRQSPDYYPLGGVAYCGVCILNALAENTLPIFVCTHDEQLPMRETAFGKLVVETLVATGLAASFGEGGNVILVTMNWQKRTITEPLPKFDFGEEDADDDRMIENDLLTTDLSDEDYEREYAEDLVWGGFLTKEEIIEQLVDDSENSEATKLLIEEMWEKKLSEEKSWPEVTDVDRLHQAFAALEAKSILAFHNLGQTNSDAMYLAGSEWERRGAEKTGILGSVSYHSQALSSARTEGVFHLGFDSYPGSTMYSTIEARMNAVGMIATRTLQEHGLKAEWNGDINTKIEVIIDWKKRAIFEPLPKLAEELEITDATGPDLVFITLPVDDESADELDVEYRNRSLN